VHKSAGTLADALFTSPMHKVYHVPYRLYITAQKYRFLPCGVTARPKNIYLFWGCGIEKRGFLAFFGACQAKIPVRGWCKLNISRVRG
jgi:hypothetical protein